MRSFTGTGLVVTALAATVAALLFPVWSYRDRTGTGAVDLTAGSVATPFGPLSALDRDFVDRVRLAGLWELPAGQQAEQRGTTAAVRRAGEHLVEGHTALDQHVREVGARLGIDLPSRPNAQQQSWLARLDAARGEAYDREFTNILRLAHGTVFTVVAQVRATTRNSAVRALADDANATVLDHIKILEATGLVDFDAIAADTRPQAFPTAPSTRSPIRHDPRPGSDSPTFPLPPAATRPPHSPGTSPATPPSPASPQSPTPPDSASPPSPSSPSETEKK
ncbi:Tat pathway signal sequence domain protein [Streptomyces griseocarneus]|nr:Tat pathway signal sequence domain protein [Streptomyces griseocarneus]